MQKTRLGNYPFRLGTTSFIYPADYSTNVRRLAPRLDEVELLLFECDHLPSPHEIETIASLGREFGITFNVHLPMDVSMGNASRTVRQKSSAAIAKAMERVAPLSPTTQTLHLDYEEEQRGDDAVKAWQERTIQSTASLIEMSRVSPRDLSVETLDFDPDWLAPIVSELDLSVCIDAGHVIRFGYDLASVLDMYAQRITIMHLHGIHQGKDHHAITYLEPDIQRLLARFLVNFHGSVSIEVFSSTRLEQSLDAFPALMARAMPEAI